MAFMNSIDAKFRHSLTQFRYNFVALILSATNAHFTYFENNIVQRWVSVFFSLKALAVVSKPAFQMNCKNVQKCLSKFTMVENSASKASPV